MLPMAIPAQEENKALRSVQDGGARAHGSPRGHCRVTPCCGASSECEGEVAGAQGPHVDAKASGRLGSRVSRMQCANSQQTRDPEWGAGARQLAPLCSHFARHKATGPHCAEVDVLGVTRTGCGLSPERSLLIQDQRWSEPKLGRQTGNSQSLTWGWHLSPSGTPTGPAWGRLRSILPLRGFLLRPILARPGFLGTRRRAGLSVGAAAP